MVFTWYPSMCLCKLKCFSYGDNNGCLVSDGSAFDNVTLLIRVFGHQVDMFLFF